MKFLIVALACVACASAEYNYQQPAAPAPSVPQRSYIPPATPAAHVEEIQSTYIPPPPPKNTYIPPAAPAPSVPQRSYIPPAPPAHVEEIQSSYIPPPPPKNTYIPPAAPAPVHVEQPKNTYIPPVEHHAQDGYRYKTVRRVVHKHRA